MYIENKLLKKYIIIYIFLD